MAAHRQPPRWAGVDGAQTRRFLNEIAGHPLPVAFVVTALRGPPSGRRLLDRWCI
jgi:hypothetical protein